MPWKKGPHDGEVEHFEKHFRVRTREWIYPIPGTDDRYVLSIGPHRTVRDKKIPDISLSWPGDGKVVKGMRTLCYLQYYSSLAKLKKELDRRGIKERPHYREAYWEVRRTLAKYL